MSPAERYQGKSLRDLATTGAIVDSMPTDMDEYCTQKDVDDIRPLLGDEVFKHSHRTLLAFIGLIAEGTSKDVDAIRSYLMQSDSDRVAAGMALGMLVARKDSAEALDLLLGLESDGRKDMAKAAVFGLGLSGHPRGLAALRGGRLEHEYPEETRTVAGLIDANMAISQRGLKSYYKRD